MWLTFHAVRGAILAVPLTAALTLSHSMSTSAMPRAQPSVAATDVRNERTAPGGAAAAPIQPAYAAAKPLSTVRVAVANVREGAVRRPPTDMADGDDREAFARRVFEHSGRAPDVVLLQEVLGTARAVTHRLNEHPTARRSDARYVVAVAPKRRQDSGSCAGPRDGSYMSVRDSAVVVNTQTVTPLQRQGTVRTWGRWAPRAHQLLGRSGYGCAEQPWIRLAVHQAGKVPATVLVASVHIAPSGVALKNRAVARTQQALDAAHRKTPQDLVVIAGDFNLTRCQRLPSKPESRGCAVRGSHKGLLAAGYADAVRSLHLTGPAGVVGVARRIDFLYTKGAVGSSWFDRCYQAYFVKRFRCEPGRVVIGQPRLFSACDRRSRVFGSPGGGCPAHDYHRYYSDHPLILATVSES